MTMMKATLLSPDTACSAQYNTVSVIRPLFMITVMPRATPMISATPSMSLAPSTKVSTRTFSGSLPTMPIRMPKNRKHAVISGNHHHHVGIANPRSSQGITP